MSDLFILLAIILFLAIKIIKKKYPNNEFVAQIGMAIMVGLIILNTLMRDSGLKYIIVILGIVVFIGTVIDIVDSKKKQTKS